MTACITSDPLLAATRIARLKYFLLGQGVGISNFHASEDSQRVRNQVFQRLAKLRNLSAHTLWLKKDDLPAEAKSTSAIYELAGLEMARIAVKEANLRHAESAVMVFDKTLIYREEQAFLSKAKAILSQLSHPFHIYFHNVSKDFNGQIADYIAWSQYVALERREFRPLAALPPELTKNLVSLVAARTLKG